MNYVEEQLVHYNKFAKSALEEQAAKLADYKQDRQLGGKLNRIRAFNDHFGALQQQLEQKVKSVLGTYNTETAKNYKELEAALTYSSVEVLNEFLCLSFVNEE